MWNGRPSQRAFSWDRSFTSGQTASSAISTFGKCRKNLRRSQDTGFSDTTTLWWYSDQKFSKILEDAKKQTPWHDVKRCGFAVGVVAGISRHIDTLLDKRHFFQLRWALVRLDFSMHIRGKMKSAKKLLLLRKFDTLRKRQKWTHEGIRIPMLERNRGGGRIRMQVNRVQITNVVQ